MSFAKLVQEQGEAVEGRVRINVFFTTGSVGTCLKHPQRQHGTQLFRRNVAAAELAAIFRDPRAHTDRGYCTREQLSGSRMSVVLEDLPLSEFEELCRHANGVTSEDVSNGRFVELLLQIEATSPTRSRFYQHPQLAGGLLSHRALYRTVVVGPGGKLGLNVAAGPQTVIPKLTTTSSSASAAGLRIGDSMAMVTVPLRGSHHLKAMLRQSDRVKLLTVGLHILREGQPMRFAVITDEIGTIGINSNPVVSSGPIVVVSFSPGLGFAPAPAQKAGVRIGDIITAVTVPADIITWGAAVAPVPPGASVGMLLLRKEPGDDMGIQIAD